MTVMQTKLDDFRALSSNLRKAVNKYKMRFRRNSIRKFEVIASSNFRGVSQERKLNCEISWYFAVSGEHLSQIVFKDINNHVTVLTRDQ